MLQILKKPKFLFRKLRISLICYITALHIIFIANAFAALDNVRFEPLSIQNQLSQQNINVIYQDSLGFIWFGTQEGLNRYDGYNIEVFTQRLGDKSSLSSSWINAIAEDNNKNLWVGTRAGVNRFNATTRTFERYFESEQGNGINDAEVKDIWTDLDGVIWVATRKGLNRFIANENRFKHYNFANDEGDVIEVNAVAVDVSGAFWLGTEKSGLFRFDGITERLTKVAPQFYLDGKLKTVRIRSLFIDSDHNLWIGTNTSGVYRLDFQSQNTESIEEAVLSVPDIRQKSVRDIIGDKNGTIWFATSSGLVSYANGAVSLIQKSEVNKFSISDDTVSSIMIDKAGVFWLGSFKGVDKWNMATTQFDHYSQYAPEGKRLSDTNITFVTALHDGRHLVGSYKGVDFIDPRTGFVESFYHEPGNTQSIKNNKVMSAKQSKDGAIWFGYRGNGLSSYDPVTQKFTHFQADKSDPNALQAGGVTAIIESADGTMWFATFGGGISRFDPLQNNFVTFRHDPSDIYSISSDRVMSIFESEDGLLWLGTWDAGISILNPNTGTVFRIKAEPDTVSGLGSESIWTVFEDSNNNIWVGTQGAGLHLLPKTDREIANIRFTRITQQEGLPSNVVYGIVEDDDGMLWVSTNKGLTRIDPNTMLIKNFTAAHGLQSSEFNSGAYYKTQSGMLLFGGPAGVTAFFPGDIKSNTHKPPTVITAFNRLNNQHHLGDVVNQKNQIELTHRDYLIGFQFAGLDFISPNDNRYKYRLKGFDESWIDDKGSRLATYTNLPAGSYTFEVVAANNDGIWNDEGAKVELIVYPPPWLSPYAYALYVFLIILLLYSMYRYFKNKSMAQKLYRESLEQEVNIRTQELSLANEQLLKVSITDQLTGLFNRRYLFEVFADKSAQTYESFIKAISSDTVQYDSGPRLFFLMFDLDGFKPINDNFGHDAGDKMIQQVAELLTQVCRMNDTVIRWGGDEFVIVGEIDDIEEVQILAELIRQSIAKHGFDIGLAQRMHLSCSMGFSVYPFSHHSPDSVSWEQVHILADKALYMSKDAGRNRWSGIVQSQLPVPFGIMNTLNQKLESAIANEHIRIVQCQSNEH